MYLLRQCAREPSCAAQRWVEMRHQDPWPVYGLLSGLSSMAGAATVTHLLARWIERRCSATNRRYAWLELFLRYRSPVDGMDGAWTLSVDVPSSCQAGVVPQGLSACGWEAQMEQLLSIPSPSAWALAFCWGASGLWWGRVDGLAPWVWWVFQRHVGSSTTALRVSCL